MNTYNLVPNPNYDIGAPTSLTVVTSDDPVKMLAANKRELLTAKINMVVDQIKVRQDIHEKRLTDIVQDELVCRNAILMHQSRCNYAEAESIELADLLALQRERRDEYASCFRDTAQLRTTLIEALLAYKQAESQARFMDSMR